MPGDETERETRGAPTQLPKQPCLCGRTSPAAEATVPVQCTSAAPKRVAHAVARDERRNAVLSIAPYYTEASQGANTLIASPDKPPESLTIRLCEQRRREADTEGAAIEETRRAPIGKIKKNRLPDYPQRIDNSEKRPEGHF